MCHNENMSTQYAKKATMLGGKDLLNLYPKREFCFANIYYTLKKWFT